MAGGYIKFLYAIICEALSAIGSAFYFNIHQDTTIECLPADGYAYYY